MIALSLQKGRMFENFMARRYLRISSNDVVEARAAEDYLTRTQSRSIATANAIDAAIADVIVCILLLHFCVQNC